MPAALTILAEPRRQEILRLVWTAERSAGDIAARFPITFGAVSQHLRVLLEAGLVRQRKDGRLRWYVADREALGPLAGALEQIWSHRLGELKRLAEAEQARIDATRGKRAGGGGRVRIHRKGKP